MIGFVWCSENYKIQGSQIGIISRKFQRSWKEFKKHAWDFACQTICSQYEGWALCKARAARVDDFLKLTKFGGCERFVCLVTWQLMITLKAYDLLVNDSAIIWPRCKQLTNACTYAAVFLFLKKCFINYISFCMYIALYLIILSITFRIYIVSQFYIWIAHVSHFIR